MDRSVLKTYMDFPEVIDPAHILTMADLELSIALGSTLVTFNDSREPVAALAERWMPDGDNKVKFVLRPDLKWSDGTKVTASQYVDALTRAKKHHGADLKALFDSLETFTATDEKTLVFGLKGDVTVQGLILKLTEPMYGLVAVRQNGELDLSKSTGPYRVKSTARDLVELESNPYFYSGDSQRPSHIELKKPTGGNAVAEFNSKSWANLVSGNSIQKQVTMNEFTRLGFNLWHRKLDKLFAMYPTKAFVERGGDKFILSLKADEIVNRLMEGLSGFTFAEQFFPRGYTLWSPEKVVVQKADAPKLERVRIVVPSSYSSIPVSEKLSKILESMTSAKTSVDLVPMSEIGDRMKRQDYDILLTGLAVADPNFEGAVSFFVERDPPFIPSTSGESNFAARVKSARALATNEERASSMRRILIDAQKSGYVLPLFHFSSFAVAKPEVDLSGIPESNETILFSKVRMK